MPWGFGVSLPVNKVSTADFACAARGWHQYEPKRIFEDPYARFLCGPFLGLILRYRPLGRLFVKVVLGPVMPTSLCVLMRARYAEQALETAVENGIRQYVLIGAGMDSFAFRRLDLLERINAFEIDHPVTQGKKLKRIREAGLTVPDNHHFVAADLSRISPVEALADSVFDESQPAFMSLLGVVYYLTPDMLAETARALARSMPTGSRLVLDYLFDEESCNPGDLEFRETMRAFVKRRGEPMRSAYSMHEMESLMARDGFRAIEHFPLKDREEDLRRQFGTLPFVLPGVFGLGTFEVV